MPRCCDAVRVGAWLVLMLAVLAGGCSSRSEPIEQPPDDATRARRVFRPPPGEVRPVPPHAIHEKGVGPYVLGTPLKAVLDLLPHGPRVVLAQIDGVVDYSLVRAERDALLVGVAQPTGVAFLAVLDREIARTESGVGVGSTEAELRAAMGPELSEPGRAMDPRLIGFEGLPNARFVVDRSDEARGSDEVRGSDEARVVAVVVRRDAPLLTEVTAEAGAAAKASPSAPCRAREALADHDSAVIEAAKLPAAGARPVVSYGCFSGGAEALVAAGERLVILGGEADKLRRVAIHSAPGMVYAAAMDTDGDGRSEIVVVTETAGERARRWSIEVLRLEASSLQRVASQTLYEISATSARWIGAELEDLDLLIESVTAADSVRVSGLFVHHGPGGPDTVVPLVPTTMQIRRKRAVVAPQVPDPSDGGVSVQGPALGDPGDAGAADTGKPAPVSPRRPAPKPPQ